MSLIPPGQFRVAMPDGLVIERMPVGLGHGHWDEQEVSLSYLADGPTAIRISYLHDDEVVATEVVQLGR